MKITLIKSKHIGRKCILLLIGILLTVVTFTGCDKNDPKNLPNTVRGEDSKEQSDDDTDEGNVNDEDNSLEDESINDETLEDSTIDNSSTPEPTESIINENGQTVEERFLVPDGFVRKGTQEGSFGEFLQNLPLKPQGVKVKYYDGREKDKNVYLAVVDYTLGDRDLQQCADVVIRLRAEYLYANHRFEEIHFNFVSGFNAEFSKWSSGKGIAVEGNTVSWTTNSNHNDSYASFQKYLNMVYAYASTLSLDKELIEKPLSDIEIGDVFIQAGSPGHCVIVVDMAEHETNGKKIFMLAQGYMPAQDIQILIGDEMESPWYSADIEGTLVTPEWTFKSTDLKTWE